MGFFDGYKDEGGGSFIGKAETEELISSKEVIAVKAVRERDGDKYGDQFLIVFDLDGEERVKSFTKNSVQSRDRMLRAMKEYLEDGGTPVGVYIKREGQSLLLVNPDEE